MKKEKEKIHYKFKAANKQKASIKWPLTITAITFGMSFAMTIIANIFTNKLSIVGAWIVLIIIVLVGILFDLLGTAVLTAESQSFESMASHKIRGAKEAISIIKKANVFSSIFNDVIGDTCGIISGATAAAIILKLAIENNSASFMISTLLSAVVAAATVGGKAFGKTIGMKFASNMVWFLARVASMFNPTYWKIKK
mgnify:CR=1 FL=1